MKTGGGSQVDGHWETQQEGSTLQEEQEFSAGTVGIKAQSLLCWYKTGCFCVNVP